MLSIQITVVFSEFWIPVFAAQSIILRIVARKMQDNPIPMSAKEINTTGMVWRKASPGTGPDNE